MTLIIVIIALALIFDYINGFHDAANSIATVVSTKVLTPFQAVMWAAMFNAAAFFLFKDHAVANTINKTVNKEFITLAVILSGLIAAIFWSLLTWWFGIPSSSSHTLIGGFAGAAIAHAMLTKGISISWGKIVETKPILKTILFIFLAPLIGMAISVCITIVTIMRNLWLRIAIIALGTTAIFLLFDRFENQKMQEGAQKFLKIDKYKSEIESIKKQIALKEEDTLLQDNLIQFQSKLDKATDTYNKISPLISNYDKLGADSIAKIAYTSGWLQEIEISKLKDAVANANGLLKLEFIASKDTTKRAVYLAAKESMEKYKEPLEHLKTLGTDSVIALMNAIYSIKDKEVIKKVIQKNDIEKTFAKNIAKSDNSVFAWGIVFTAIFFCLVYLYVEKIRTPTAFKIGNMFKQLQLISSAAFSLGHGGNDAQKVMGIIGAALIASGNIQDFSQLPRWVPISCYLAIGLGTMSGGWKIIKTMGTKITKVTPLEGVAAETSGALTLFFTGQMGIPVSTTHTITGSIIGVGATKRLSAVRWGVTVNLLWAWILTIPVSGLLAAIIYYITTFF